MRQYRVSLTSSSDVDYVNFEAENDTIADIHTQTLLTDRYNSASLYYVFRYDMYLIVSEDQKLFLVGPNVEAGTLRNCPNCEECKTVKRKLDFKQFKEIRYIRHYFYDTKSYTLNVENKNGKKEERYLLKSYSRKMYSSLRKLDKILFAKP